MARMKIFNTLEEEAFESPPEFNSAERNGSLLAADAQRSGGQFADPDQQSVGATELAGKIYARDCAALTPLIW